MADLTNSVVQKYVQIPAGQDVGDRFDQDNFYPMDGIVDESDMAFSELFGGKLKKLTKKGGSEKGLVGEVGNLLSTRAESEGVSRLEKRLERRNRRSANRAKRRGMRITARGERQLAREQALNPQVKQTRAAIVVSAGLGVKEPIAKVEDGQGDPKDELVVEKTNSVAEKLLTKKADLDTEVVKDELAKVKTDDEALVILDEILDDENGRGKKGWKGLQTGAKVGIIAGGVVVLGLVTYLIVKASR